MTKRIPVDEKKLPAVDNIQRAVKLLEWARSKGFRIGPELVVGDVSFQVADIRQPRIEGTVGERLDDDGDVYDGAEEPAEGTVG